MRIVFMGTPEFAVPPLMALVDAGYDIAAVCTQPDRPSGRSYRKTASPVSVAAEKEGIRVIQVERIRSQEGLDALRALSADLFVTAAYGQILSRKVLDIPPLGTVNLHASLLPKYRGPAPINWCLMEGAETTGVTTMMTDVGIDTGDILMSRETKILPGEAAGDLTRRLAIIGSGLLVETLQRLEAGDCPRTPQDELQATRHPMLEKAHGRIDWQAPAPRVAALVHGVNPWPGAWTLLPDGGTLKVWKARPAEGAGMPGEILVADGKRGLVVACGEGALEIIELQAPGAKRMPSAAYLRGKPMEAGRMFGVEAK